MRSLDIAVRGRNDTVEVIFVDDGSTDLSTETCSRLCLEYKFKLVVCKDNQGVSAARTRGLCYCNGEWVTFLDVDDTMLPEGIDIILKYVEKYKEYNVIQFNHDRYYVELNKRVCKYKNKTGQYNCIDSFEDLKSYTPVWNKVYKRKFLYTNCIEFDYGLNFGEDLLFNLKCTSVDPMLYHVGKSSILRYFDNKYSLARSSDIESFVMLIRHLCDMISSSNDTRFQDLVRKVIIKECSSSWCKDIVIGGN